MRRIYLIIGILMVGWMACAQPVGYYNGIAGLKGDELKTKLHEIINDHVDFGYSQARYLINYSDADPENEENVILFYTQRSQNANTYGSGGDNINREHVWAKSHGNFEGIRPMDGDAFNLRPADASVNMDRSNYDFGNVQPNGTQHEEATECWYTSRRWEPGDATKGQVARIIFYMATRYEGGEGEIDLEAINGFDTADGATHGDLATLLEWNRQFPPSDFERRRNNRLYTIQQNRNPFIDHPELADLIWAEAFVPAIRFDNYTLNPEIPRAGETASLAFNISSDIDLSELKFMWGKAYNSEQNEIVLPVGAESQSVEMDLSAAQPGEFIHYKVLAIVFGDTTISRGYFELPEDILYENTHKIEDVQGTGLSTPVMNQTVTIAGRVVGNFDNTVYIQSGKDSYSGMCVYGALETGYVGDSLVITGKVVEYANLTELTEVSYVYNFGNNQPYEPLVITTDEIGEQYEGMLVSIKDVSFEQPGEIVPDESVTYAFSDSEGKAGLFSRYGSRLVGKTIPYGVANVTGVVSQYQGDYQILLRDINDLSAGLDTVAPEVTGVAAIDRAWITVDFNEFVDKASAELLENYSFSEELTALSAFRYEEGTTVIINVEGLSNGSHQLTVSGVKDLSGNTMENVTIDFTANFTGISEAKIDEAIRIYPNPVLDKLLFVDSDISIEALKLINARGNVVLHRTNMNQVESIRIDQPGLYVLELITKNKQIRRQKVVVH